VAGQHRRAEDPEHPIVERRETARDRQVDARGSPGHVEVGRQFLQRQREPGTGDRRVMAATAGPQTSAGADGTCGLRIGLPVV